jgi:hypothetical protein
MTHIMEEAARSSYPEDMDGVRNHRSGRGPGRPGGVLEEKMPKPSVKTLEKGDETPGPRSFVVAARRRSRTRPEKRMSLSRTARRLERFGLNEPPEAPGGSAAVADRASRSVGIAGGGRPDEFSRREDPETTGGKP